MKKILTLVLFATMMLATTVNAQVRFGVKGGLNVTDMSLSNDMFDASNRTGFFIGPTVKISLPLTGLGIDASALYDQRSTKLSLADDDDIYSETIKQKSIQIPVNLRYGVGLGSLASVFMFAGPQFGFNVGGDIDDIDWKWKNSALSVNVGLGATLLKNLQITANYNIACGTTGESSLSDAVESVYDGFKGKSNSWQIAVGYYF